MSAFFIQNDLITSHYAKFHSIWMTFNFWDQIQQVVFLNFGQFWVVLLS